MTNPDSFPHVPRTPEQEAEMRSEEIQWLQGIFVAILVVGLMNFCGLLAVASSQ